MRIVIASDKFKGSATGAEVADALALGIREIIPDAEIEAVPVADGGEGTVDAALASGFEAVDVRVTGPTGEPVTARFAVRGAEAVIEMAAASGLDVLPGVTGPAQVAGIDMATPVLMAEVEQEYFRRATPLSDVMLIVRTVFGAGSGDVVGRR